MKKSTLLIFPAIAILLLIAAFFLVPAIQQSVLGEITETIVWKNHTVDLNQRLDRTEPSISNGETLSVSLSVGQGKNDPDRGKDGSVDIVFKDIDVSQYGTVEILLNGKATVADSPQGTGVSSGVGVSLGKYSCGKGAYYNQQLQQNIIGRISLFKVENKGGGFYRIQSDCGTELITTNDKDLFIRVNLGAATTTAAYAHSASSEITIFDIKTTKSTSPPVLEEIKEELQSTNLTKEEQVEVISESSLAEEQQKETVTLIAQKEEKEQLIILLEEIKEDRRQSQQRMVYIAIGASIILLGALATYLIKKR